MMRLMRSDELLPQIWTSLVLNGYANEKRKRTRKGPRTRCWVEGRDWTRFEQLNLAQKGISQKADAKSLVEVVVRRIRESGFEDSNLFANFAGEREDSNPKAKDSNLCCQVKST
jgi:hypothetical protein